MVAEKLPKPGAHVCAQGSNDNLYLAKVVDNRIGPDNHWWTLLRWIEVRRDAEWVPSFTVPTP